MEFWVDLALAILFRFLRGREIPEAYFPAFTKLYYLLGELLPRHDDLPPPNGVKG